MPTQQFRETFAALRSVLESHAKKMTVTVDKPGHYVVASPTMTDRTGRPLFFGSVQIKKSYVSYHLMPLYMDKALCAGVSPALKKRMQGKACFNFTSVEATQLKDLAAITRKASAGFKNLKLPWA